MTISAVDNTIKAVVPVSYMLFPFSYDFSSLPTSSIAMTRMKTPQTIRSICFKGMPFFKLLTIGNAFLVLLKRAVHKETTYEQ